MPDPIITSKKHSKKIEEVNREIERAESNRQYLLRTLESYESSPSSDKNTDQPGRDGLLSNIENVRQKIVSLDARIHDLKTSRDDQSSRLIAPAEKLLAEANGRASTYTLNMKAVEALALEVEQELAEKGVLVRHRAGAVFVYRPAGKVASRSYEQISRGNITTRVILRRNTDGWRLSSAERSTCYVNQRAERSLSVPQAAFDDIVRAATANINVTDPQ